MISVAGTANKTTTSRNSAPVTGSCQVGLRDRTLPSVARGMKVGKVAVKLPFSGEQSTETGYILHDSSRMTEFLKIK